jgi:hypothetical protein
MNYSIAITVKARKTINSVKLFDGTVRSYAIQLIELQPTYQTEAIQLNLNGIAFITFNCLTLQLSNCKEEPANGFQIGSRLLSHVTQVA